MDDKSNPKLLSNWIFIDPENYVDQKVSDYARSLIMANASKLGLDMNLAQKAYGEKRTTDKFFNNVIDLFAFDSVDDRALKSTFKDWYTAFKTEISKLRKIKNYNLLTTAELNEFILSFGYPYAQNIPGRSAKIAFLNNIVELYQKKGTLDSLNSILKIYRLRNITISEWWIKYSKTRNKPFFAESNVIYPFEKRNVAAYKNTMEYAEFIENNPFWRLSLKELNDGYFRKKNRVKLPSLTSAISVDAYANVTKLNPVFGLFQRKFQETYDYWVSHTLIPISTPANLLNRSKFLFKKSSSQTIDAAVPELNIPELCINIKISNHPPKMKESDLFSEYDTVLENNNYYYFMIGPNPVISAGETTHNSILSIWNETNKKKIVRILRNGNNVNVEVLNNTSLVDFDIGTIFYTDETSPLYKNSIIKYTTIGFGQGVSGSLGSSSTVAITQMIKNSCITMSIKPEPNSVKFQSIVYNGKNWVYLGKYYPPKESRKLLPNYRNFINRNITLNNYLGVYSLFEIILALCIGYQRFILENNPSYTPNENYLPTHDNLTSDDVLKIPRNAFDSYFYYNGDHAHPGLDLDYNDWQDSTEFVFDNLGGVKTWPGTYPRTDIDAISGQYDKITEEYESLVNVSTRNSYSEKIINNTERQKFPYFEIMKDRDEYVQKFSRKLNPYMFYDKDFYNDILSGLYPQKHCETFLQAVNPDFYDDIVKAFERTSYWDVVCDILADLENYAKNIIELSNYSFSHVMTGGAGYRDELKSVIEFFKPFRTYLLDFQTKFLTEDPLNDCVIFGDQSDDKDLDVSGTITIIEKPFPTTGTAEYLADGITSVAKRDIKHNSKYGTINYGHKYDHGFFTDYLIGYCEIDVEGENRTDIIEINVMNTDNDETNRIVTYPSDENDLPDKNNWILYNPADEEQ